MSAIRSREPLPLFDQPPAPRLFAPKRGSGRVQPDHRAAAEAWRRQHPDGWALLEAEAAERAAAGQRFGMKALVEYCRWCLRFKTQDGGAAGYKLNNNHTATFARMLIAEHPDWAQFIETRGDTEVC